MTDTIKLRMATPTRADCPACGRSCDVRSHHPERSGLWAHYHGKKCRAFRKNSGETFPVGGDLSLLIKQADNRGKRQLKEIENTQRQDKIARKREQDRRVSQKHTVTGGFLMDVVSQIESVINMMEPYYSQCDGDADARKMISELENTIKSNGG